MYNLIVINYFKIKLQVCFAIKKLNKLVFLVSFGFYFLCSDIDECKASSPVCDVNALCSNTRGSFSCACKLGFSGDGKTCQGLSVKTKYEHKERRVLWGLYYF